MRGHTNKYIPTVRSDNHFPRSSSYHLCTQPDIQMPRRAAIKYVSLKSCLVNLPLSIYGPLVQNQVVCLYYCCATHPSLTSIAFCLRAPTISCNTPVIIFRWTGITSEVGLCRLDGHGRGFLAHHVELAYKHSRFAARNNRNRSTVRAEPRVL